MNSLKFGSLCVYLLINTLFVAKYVDRIEGVNFILCSSAYILMIAVFIYLYVKINLRDGIYKSLFWGTTIFFFLFTILLNIYVDGNSLNVDRWSAMDVGVKALLNSEYPYSAIDHLNGRTSNLPSLLFIGIPFFVLGDVGYLQSFSFLIFCTAILFFFRSYKDRLFCLLLMILSSSYLWEIYAKSDLMSNFIWILFFVILYINRVLCNKKEMRVWIVAFFASSLFLTRIISFIPLSLLLFKHFISYSLREKTIFLTVSIVTILLFTYICFHNANSLEEIMTYNPIELQNRQLPTIVSLIFIVIPLFFSLYIRKQSTLILACASFLFLPVIVSFFKKVHSVGLYDAVFLSAFDISYFNMCMPFLLFFIAFSFSKEFKEKGSVLLI